jgi:cytochrome c oxidase assembly factor CtaG
LLTRPLIATILQGVALWAWHIPALYALALRDDTIHRLQHLSFILSALLFWWLLFHRRRHHDEEQLDDGIKVACLFVTALHSGLLGALMTLSSRLWYPSQTVLSADWGLSPLEDQQLAGLVMWVPMGVVYAAAALYFASRWIHCAQSKHITPDAGMMRWVGGNHSTGVVVNGKSAPFDIRRTNPAKGADYRRHQLARLIPP